MTSEKGKTKGDSKTSGCQELREGGMKKWSTKDVLSSETALFDTITIDSFQSSVISSQIIHLLYC